MPLLLSAKAFNCKQRWKSFTFSQGQLKTPCNYSRIRASEVPRPAEGIVLSAVVRLTVPKRAPREPCRRTVAATSPRELGFQSAEYSLPHCQIMSTLVTGHSPAFSLHQPYQLAQHLQQPSGGFHSAGMQGRNAWVWRTHASINVHLIT